MRIYKLMPWAGTLCALALPLAAADDLTLADGVSSLTGTVRSINAEGLVELASPLSPEPLLLRNSGVRKIEFSGAEATPEPPPALVELTNGDLLPVRIEKLDPKVLTVTSPVAGRLEIPRDRLTSVQLGVQLRKVLYTGPRSLKEWTDGEGDGQNWAFRPGGLVADGRATASRMMELPRQFVLRFTLKWPLKKVPNYQVYFADPLKPKGEASDRYYLQFGRAGLEIKREAAKGKRYNTIAQLNRTPNQYPDAEMRVELRVDRDGSRLQLFINGEPEGEFFDPISPVPDGAGISLVCNGSSGTEQEIRDIEVTEFDDSRARHRSEERGDAKTDSLISREDERWGGHLVDIRKTSKGAVFHFKSDFQTEPLEIPEADVSTLFFASGEAAAPPGDPKPPLLLRLLGKGALRVSSCRVSGDTVSAVHPLLGALEFGRDGVVSLERIVPKPEPEPEPEPETEP